MEVTRKPLAKIEGRKRMQASGLTVAWQGTRGLKDWAAYLEDGAERERLVLAHHVSERALKSLLARIQNLSREQVEAMSRPVEAIDREAESPSLRRSSSGGGEEGSGAEIAVPSGPGRHLALSSDGATSAAPAARPRRRRLPAAVETAAPEHRRPVRAAPREVPGALRQLRSRVESLEAEQEQLRAELAMLRGEAEAYDGPPSIFVTGWFRATLMLIVLAIVVVITVPWLMDLFEGGPPDPRPPVRTEAPVPVPSPPR
jgi:hypothetical protein